MDQRGSADPQIVTINAADMMLKAMSTVDPSITKEQLSTYVRAMNTNLGDVVTRFAAQNNVVVVNSASVLSGAPDVTDNVLSALQEVVR